MKKYSILVNGKEYFNNWYSKNLEGVKDVLNHLKSNSLYATSDYNLEIVEITENIIKNNNLNCLEELLECYLLDDGNIYFSADKEIKEITYNGLKWIKINVKKEDIKDSIIKRIFWNGWNIHEYIPA
jgi:hypothetical protein